MNTDLVIILGLGAAFSGWAALALMGGERARRRIEVESQRPPTAVVLSSPPPAGTPAASASKIAVPPRKSKASTAQNVR